jgi:hypothetical protein
MNRSREVHRAVHRTVHRAVQVNASLLGNTTNKMCVCVWREREREREKNYVTHSRMHMNKIGTIHT